MNVLHHQLVDDAFHNCSLCEISKYYKPIFDLTDKEVSLPEEYMKSFELLHQCCGVQMSKYNRYRYRNNCIVLIILNYVIQIFIYIDLLLFINYTGCTVAM